MKLVHLAAVAVTVALPGAVVTTAMGQSAAHTKLIGTVGKNDAFKITLTTSSGKLVKSLAAGTHDQD
jgi:hypothetical protein